MGALITWLVRGLYWGGSAAIGYFINDLAAGVANVTGLGSKTVDPKTGKFAWWFIVPVAVVSGIVLYLATKMISKKKVYSWLIFLIGCSLALAFPAHGEYIGAGVIFTIAASTTETKSIPSLTEFITFNATTVPTSFIIDIAGDGNIFKLDGTGLTNLNGLRFVGTLAANQYVYQVADGYVNKKATFTVANAVAGTLTVYGWSTKEGTFYNLHQTDRAINNSNTIVADFFYVAFPTAATGDLFTVTWSNGTTETMHRSEFETMVAFTQAVSATRYNADNFKRIFSKIQFKPGADQNIYWLRKQDVRGQTVNNSL